MEVCRIGIGERITFGYGTVRNIVLDAILESRSSSLKRLLSESSAGKEVLKIVYSILSMSRGFDSVMVCIAAWEVEDPGSIPARSAFVF